MILAKGAAPIYKHNADLISTNLIIGVVVLLSELLVLSQKSMLVGEAY